MDVDKDRDNGRYFASKLVTEPFADERLQRAVWGEHWGITSPVGRIRKVLVHRPGPEVEHMQDGGYEVEAGPVVLRNIHGYRSAGRPAPIDLALLQEQHDRLTDMLRREGAEVVPLQPSEDSRPDRVFTRDLGAVVPGGIVLSRFALYIRYGETPAAQQAAARIGMPILGMIQGHGYMEGGSFTFVHERLALAGRSERVNDEGIRQLRQILALHEIELIAVDLPASLIHLDEALVMVDRDKALIDIHLLPYWLLERLQREGIQLIQVDPRDPPLTVNCLTASPGRVLFPASGKRTAELLAKHGVTAMPLDVSELVKLGGGIHCATLPLVRDPV